MKNTHMIASGNLGEVAVMKFAFIMDVKGASPETYSTVFETAGRYNLVAGVDGQEAAAEYIEKLAAEGFDEIDLSGDFDDEFAARIAEEVRKKAGDSIEIKNTRYTIDELMKLQFIDSSRNYGIIIMDEDVDRYHEVVLRCKARDTRIIFVQNLQRARHAVAKLAEKRVSIIDLCSWFDVLRHEPISVIAGNGIAVGTCGELNLMKIEGCL